MKILKTNNINKCWILAIAIVLLNSCGMEKKLYSTGYYSEKNGTISKTKTEKAPTLLVQEKQDLRSQVNHLQATMKDGYAETEVSTRAAMPVLEKGSYLARLNECDMIVMRNGDEIPAKVFEIGDTEIKYKKCDNQNGPTYSLKKEDVLMVKYPNGSKDVFEQSKQQIGQQQQNDKSGNPQQSKKKLDTWSLLSFVAGLLMLVPFLTIGYYALMALIALTYG
ncbi:MAG: hypothetical protein H0X62_11170, partial [Bacteroidetes bacterium]|nr:hypothetical protein [Bacteroidota bacterium]